MIRLEPRFAELAAMTNFSFLRGASHPEEMVARAAELGLAGIGIADRNTLAGVVRAHTFARENAEAMAGARVVPGARLAFIDGSPDALVYPKDRAAYGRLCRILTEGNLRAPKGECWLKLDDLLERSEGLQVVALPSPWRASPPPPTRGRRERSSLAGRWGGRCSVRLREAFGERLWIGASLTYGADMRGGLARRAALARAVGAPLIATNDALMHAPERRALADVLACIREKTTLEAAGLLTQANAERHLKAPREMARLFAEAPEAVAETIRFLDGLTFSLDELSHCYPEELREGHATAQEALEAFAQAGAEARYPDGVPERTREALTHELELIASLDYAPYFLTVHDIVRFARSKGILCQGRGSAANSAVCFCLGVTEVDPARFDLLFERFISPERNEPPDIDVDFEHERREEVIQYIYQRYGRERAGLAAAVITYRTRSAIRETAKVFGLSDDVIAALNGTAWGQETTPIDGTRVRAVGLDPADPTLKLALEMAKELIGFPRHLTQHSGGFVITRDRLDEVMAGDEHGDEGPHDGRMGQGRSRRARSSQGRRAGARHADGAEQGFRSSRQTLRRAADAGDHSARGGVRLRDDPARRHDRRVPDRKPCADVDAAAAQAGELLRSRHRGCDRAPRPDPGRHGASLFAPPAGPRGRLLSLEGA